MNFNKRLQSYREKLNIKTKREMAKKLGVSEQLYYMLENGTREPSKDVLRKLYLMSALPEEYWLYGIDNEKELVEKREEFKCLKDAIEQLSTIGLLKATDNPFTPAIEEVLVAAMKADVQHLLEKRKQKS